MHLSRENFGRYKCSVARDRVQLETAAFGKAIAFLRTCRGWTQAELAERAGAGESRISTWENGKQMPRDSSVEKLARAFGVPPANLYGLQHALSTYVRSHPTDFEVLLEVASVPRSPGEEVREPPTGYQLGDRTRLNERWQELARDRGAMEERQTLLLRDTLLSLVRKTDSQ